MKSAKVPSVGNYHIPKIEDTVTGSKFTPKSEQEDKNLNYSSASDCFMASQSSSPSESFSHHREMNNMLQENKSCKSNDHSLPRLGESPSSAKKRNAFISRRKGLLYAYSPGFDTTNDNEFAINVSPEIEKKVILYTDPLQKNEMLDIPMVVNDKKELLSSHSHHFSFSDIENIKGTGGKGYHKFGSQSSFVTWKAKRNDSVNSLAADKICVNQNIEVDQNTKFFKNLLQNCDTVDNSKIMCNALEQLPSCHISIKDQENTLGPLSFSSYSNEVYASKDETYSAIPMISHADQLGISNYLSPLASPQTSTNGEQILVEKKLASPKTENCDVISGIPHVKNGLLPSVNGVSKVVGVPKVESSASSEGESNVITEYVRKRPCKELKIPEKGNRHDIASKNIRRGRDSLTQSPSYLQRSSSKTPTNDVSDYHCNSLINSYEQAQTCYSISKLNLNGSPAPLPRWASPKLVGTLNPTSAIHSDDTTEESLSSLTISNNTSDTASTGRDESSPEDFIAEDSAVVLKRFRSENIVKKSSDCKLTISDDFSDTTSTGIAEYSVKDSLANDSAVELKRLQSESNVQKSFEGKISIENCFKSVNIGKCSNLITNGHSVEQDIAKSYRIFNGGHESFTSKHAVICESDLRNIFNEHIINELKNEAGKIRIRRLQSYTWQAISSDGSACFVISGKRTGKTIGYAAPLLSNLLDSFMLKKRKHSCGAGPMMIVLCSTWEKADDTLQAFKKLLPDRFSKIKIISGWGGMGFESEKDLRRQIFIGCDLFITTPSCLSRLMIADKEADLPSITFSKINYLVFDDADEICKLNLDKIFCIFDKWIKGFSKESSDDCRQLVFTGSTWSKHIMELYNIVSGIFQTRIIISAHLEAAVAVKVQNIIHYARDKQSPFSIALQLLKDDTLRKIKTIIFVDTKEDGKHIKSLLESVAIPSDVVCNDELMWRVKEIICKWKQSSSFVIIVCDQVCNQLYQFDAMDADAILQIGVPDSELLFGRRYSFMLDNYSCNLDRKSNVVSHVILSSEMVQRNSYVVNCLKRMGSFIPEEIECTNVECFNLDIKKREPTELCYFVKAFGLCEVGKCPWRHSLVLKDEPLWTPEEGEIEFQVIEVINASRYFVLLSTHIDSISNCKTDLGHFYSVLFMKLQQYYCKREHQKVVKSIKFGMFIAAYVKAKFWTRGKVMKVDHEHKLATVLFIDEGFSQIINNSQLYYLPENFTTMPPMCIEVYLCNVQPMDKDHSWAPVATNTIKNILINQKMSRTTVFRGKIKFALNNILWLGPVKPLMKIGSRICPEVPLRGRLCTDGFGEDNPLHLKCLQDLYQISELSSLQLPKERWLQHYKLGEKALKHKREFAALSLNSMVISGNSDNRESLILTPPTNATCDDHSAKTNGHPNNSRGVVADTCVIKDLLSPIISGNANCDRSASEVKNLESSDVAKEKSVILKNRDDTDLNYIDEQISEVKVSPCEVKTEKKAINQKVSTLLLNTTKVQIESEQQHLSEAEDWKSGNLLRKNSDEEDLSKFHDSFSDKTNNSLHDVKESLECAVERPPNSSDHPNNEMSVLGKKVLEMGNDGQLQELELFSINDDLENNALVPLDNNKLILEDIINGEEIMTVGDILEIDVSEIVSPFQFYIRKAKNNDRLSILEDRIQIAIKDLKIFDNCLPGDICLSKFADGRFYRGKILNVQNEFCDIFFLDHGESMEICKTEVYPCPQDIFESLPAQCLECQLANVDIPDHLLLKAIENMEEIVDDTGIWMLEVMDIGTRDGNIVYIVDLIDTTRAENKFLTQSLLKRKVVIPSGDKLIDIDNGPKIVEITESELSQQPIIAALNSSSPSRTEFAMTSNEAVIKPDSIDLQSEDLPTSEFFTLSGKSLDPELAGNINLDVLETNLESECDGKLSHNSLVSPAKNVLHFEQPPYLEAMQSSPKTGNQISSEFMTGSQDNQLETDNLNTLSKPSHGQQTNCAKEYISSDSCCRSSLVTANRNGDMLLLNNLNSIGNIANGAIRKPVDESEPIAMSSSLEGINLKCFKGETELSSSLYSKSHNIPEAKCECKLSSRRHRPKENNTKNKHSNTLIKKIGTKGHLNEEMPPLEDFSSGTDDPAIRNPGTFWKQDEEKIYLRFGLVDVSEFECKINSNKVIFQTSVKDIMYNFHEELFAAVDPDKSFIKTHGLYTAVTLQKQHKENWSRLLLKDGTVPWLRKDISMDDFEDSDSSDNEPYSCPLTFHKPDQKLDSGDELHRFRVLPSDPSDIDSDSYSSSDDDIFKFG